MALKLNDGTVLRNLEEQVLKNKEDIANHYNIDRVLADFGIRIIGQFSSPASLQGVVGERYGDAYAIGEAPPYSIWVWTRADINSGHPEDYWFNIGPIAVVGPQGPEGPRGVAGQNGQSTRWYTNSVVLPSGGSFKQGDMLLQTGPASNSNLGNVYSYDTLSKTWILQTNIRGPQGPQGPQGIPGEPGRDGLQGPPGPQGDVGGFINIWGVLTDVAQLPLPSSLQNLTVAYLVEHTGGTDQANDHYDLYIQVGSTSATADWVNAGPFNAATLVTEGGVGLNVWDADSKVDRMYTAGYNTVYANNSNGDQTLFKLQTGGIARVDMRDRIPVYQDANSSNIASDATPYYGTIYAVDPVKNQQVATKHYVDSTISGYHDKQYCVVYLPTADWAADSDQTWNHITFSFGLTSDLESEGAVNQETIANYLWGSGYDSVENAAVVTNAQSNTYSISSPLISIWSEDGTTLKAKAPTRDMDITLNAWSTNYIYYCKH